MRITEKEYQAIMDGRRTMEERKASARLIMIPIRVISEANMREHWRIKHNRKKDQQLEVKIAFQQAARQKAITRPLRVILRRIGEKKLDTDNLAGSFKHVRDAIAKIIGVDDGDDAISWHYEQRAIGKRKFSVECQFEYK